MEKQQIAKLLGLKETADWPEIYAEIGRLKERAEKNTTYTPIYYPPQTVSLPPNPNLHYHGEIPCYKNPCVWC